MAVSIDAFAVASRQSRTAPLACAAPTAGAEVSSAGGCRGESVTALPNGAAWRYHDARDGPGDRWGADTEQLVSASLLPRGSLGALLRARRHRALLSQEQLAARAELSERTVRDLEAGRVRSPRTDTVRLLADALQLTGPERESWYEAARNVNHQQAGPTAPRAGSSARVPGDALTASDSGRGNNRRCHRWPPAEFETETVAPGRREERPADRLAEDVDPD
jgi:transcriptional regulator with XRE-family HTH domain